MDTTPPGENRDHTVGHHPASGVTGGTPIPPDLADHAVHVAEEILSDAWIQVLVTHRDQAHATMLAATERCDAARRDLARALPERAPTPIATAYAVLEQALSAGRRATRSYQNAQEGLALELDRLFWQNIQRRMQASTPP